MMRAIILQATKMRPAVLVFALALALTGCVYRMNIQQGNYLEAKTVDQLQNGMTRSQVRYLLGTPMVPDAFDDDRWDYLYYLKKGRLRAPEQRHLVVHFENDKVARVDRVAIPEGEKLPMPDVDPAPRPSDVAPSEPAATQPENAEATQPGEPRPPTPPRPQPPEEEPLPETGTRD
jgi:outer membrane protein assembly factor BamE